MGGVQALVSFVHLEVQLHKLLEYIRSFNLVAGINITDESFLKAGTHECIAWPALIQDIQMYCEEYEINGNSDDYRKQQNFKNIFIISIFYYSDRLNSQRQGQETQPRPFNGNGKAGEEAE